MSLLQSRRTMFYFITLFEFFNIMLFMNSTFTNMIRGNNTLLFNSGAPEEGCYYPPDNTPPTITIHTQNYTYFSCDSEISLTLTDNFYLKALYYKIDSYLPEGVSNLDGWYPVFTDCYQSTVTGSFPINLTLYESLEEGFHTIYFKVWDSYENINDGPYPQLIIQIDCNSPYFIIKPDGITFYNSPPPISVDFYDNIIVEAAYYNIDDPFPSGSYLDGWNLIFEGNQNSYVSSEIYLDTTLWNSLTEGLHRIYFKVWDAAGNINESLSYYETFYKDITAPDITIFTASGQKYSSAPEISISCTDNFGIDDAYYKIDSYFPLGLVTTDWISIFQDHDCTVRDITFMVDCVLWNDLNDGIHKIYFKVTDDAGNVNDGEIPEWIFIKDSAGPVITVNTPQNSYFDTIPLIDVDFYDGCSLDAAYYKIDSFLPLGLDTTNWIPIFTNHEGNSETEDFLIDATLWDSLSQGSHIIYFKVWDDLGHINDGEFPSLRIIKDSELPLIIINSLNNSYFNQVPSINVDFIDNCELNSAYYRVDSYTPTGLSTTGWVLLFSEMSVSNLNTNFLLDDDIWAGLDDGMHTIYFKVWDNCDNINDGMDPHWVFYKDTASPSIKINLQNDLYFNANPILDVDFMDLYGLDAAFYAIDPSNENDEDIARTTNWIPIFSNLELNIYESDFQMQDSEWTSLLDGLHIVNFKVIDKAGNINNDFQHSWYFYKDSGLPHFLISNLQGNYYKTSPLLYLELYDNLQLESAYYQVDEDQKNTKASSRWVLISDQFFTEEHQISFRLDSTLWAELDQGLHTIYFLVSDSAGNINQSKTIFWQFYKDEISPIISLTNANNQENLVIGFELKGSVTDNMKLDSVYYHWDGDLNQEVSDENLTIIAPTSTGQHNLTIYARDKAGNWAIVQYEFQLIDPNTSNLIVIVGALIGGVFAAIGIREAMKGSEPDIFYHMYATI